MSTITINTKNQNSPFQNKPLSSSSQHDNKPSEDKGISNAAKMAIGATALATIIIAGFATKGKLWGKGINKVVETPKNESELNLLKEQASKLKEKIKVDYQQELSKFKPFDELSLLEQDALRYENKYNGRKPYEYIASSKDWKTIKKYLKNLHADVTDDQFNNFYYPVVRTKEKYALRFKNILSNLSQDTDYVMLRNARRSIVKEMLELKNGERYNKLYEQLESIDLFLAAKIKNKPDLYKAATGMDIQDAAILLKNGKLVPNLKYEGNELAKVSTEILQKEFTSGRLEDRSLLSLFEDYPKYKKAARSQRDLELYFEECDENVIKTQDYIKELALNFRKSDDVQKLKELNSKIKELSK
ncbi:MAG: hypothetical protein ACI4S3_07085 [Candidatus Gastranaerophilaceae bacterium]